MTTPYDHVWGRTELLVGKDGLARLAAARVAVYGLGGVGGYAAEALARAGVGFMRLVDGDVVEPSNQNRQLAALASTMGMSKAEVMAARIRDINPEISLEVFTDFMTPETVSEYVGGIGYAIDAIDQIGSKVALLAALHATGVKTVSCLGAAGKLNPVGIRVCDLHQTKVCPLAKRVRLELRDRGVTRGITCVHSEERRSAVFDTGECAVGKKRLVQGSISYVPGLVGLTAAGALINQILEEGDAGD